MNLVIFGATGGTGRHIVAQALAAGHTVTAVARRADVQFPAHPRFRIVRGDVLDPTTTAAAIAGQDAVISAIGPHGRGATAIYSAGITNILAGMEAAGVRRLIALSASGLDSQMSVPFPLNLVMRFIVRPLLRNGFADAARMEAILAQSPLDWTVIRAPMLTDKPATGRYRSAVNGYVHHAVRLARADLADYALRSLADPTLYRARVEVAD